MKSSMVYVVQDPGDRIDVTPAMKFGAFKVLLPPGDVILSPDRCVSTLRKALKTFSDDDYILPIGDPAGMMVACHVAAEANRGVVNILRWVKRQNDYVPIKLDFRPPSQRES